jgi:hypothetical protein
MNWNCSALSPLRGERIEVRGSITHACWNVPTLTLPSPFQRERWKIAE